MCATLCGSCSFGHRSPARRSYRPQCTLLFMVASRYSGPITTNNPSSIAIRQKSSRASFRRTAANSPHSTCVVCTNKSVATRVHFPVIRAHPNGSEKLVAIPKAFRSARHTSGHPRSHRLPFSLPRTVLANGRHQNGGLFHS